jgi:hypothetical protein
MSSPRKLPVAPVAQGGMRQARGGHTRRKAGAPQAEREQQPKQVRFDLRNKLDMSTRNPGPGPYEAGFLPTLVRQSLVLSRVNSSGLRAVPQSQG